MAARKDVPGLVRRGESLRKDDVRIIILGLRLAL